MFLWCRNNVPEFPKKVFAVKKKKKKVFKNKIKSGFLSNDIENTTEIPEIVPAV